MRAWPLPRFSFCSVPPTLLPAAEEAEALQQRIDELSTEKLGLEGALKEAGGGWRGEEGV